MDAVSDVLRAVRLSGAVYLNGEFTEPWCVIGQGNAALYGAFLPLSERVVSYHLIIEGHCCAQLAGNQGSAIHLNAGELLVVPQGEAHIIGSDLALSPESAAPLLASQLQSAPGQVMKLSYGGGGTGTRLICGFLACDNTLSNPLLSSLPPIFKVDLRNDPHSAWLTSSLQFAAAEASEWRAGSAIVSPDCPSCCSSKRSAVVSIPCPRTAKGGWRACATGSSVVRYQCSMRNPRTHGPSMNSREKWVCRVPRWRERFSDLLGQPPMQYLARWRLQVAAQELLTGSKSLAAVAEQVGYESEAAFNRAFKREFGTPPAGWRKNQGAADAAGSSVNTIEPVGEPRAAA